MLESSYCGVKLKLRLNRVPQFPFWPEKCTVSQKLSYNNTKTQSRVAEKERERERGDRERGQRERGEEGRERGGEREGRVKGTEKGESRQ